MKVTLKFPIVTKEEGKPDSEIRELTIGRLKAKHMKLMPESAFLPDGEAVLNPTELLPLIGALCSLSEEQTGEIDVVDLKGISAALTDFLADSQPAESKQNS